MLKLLGAVLLVGCTVCVGAGAAAKLAKKVKCIDAFICALELMRSDMRFRVTQLPDMMSDISKTAPPEAARFFACCSDRAYQIGEKPFGVIWRECLAENSLDLPDAEAYKVVLELGSTVGSYGLEDNISALEGAIDRLSRIRDRAAKEKQRQSKVYLAMGIASGLMTVIIFI